MLATTPPPGLILEVARQAGLAFKLRGEKAVLRCPFHQDRSPSAAIFPATNAFFCFRCTPNGGWSAKRFAQALGEQWGPAHSNPVDRLQPPRRDNSEHQPFGPAEARQLWSRALTRARDDEAVERDEAVYGFLARRQIDEAWEAGLFGVLAPGMELSGAVRWWPARGYRLLVQLVDLLGEIVSIQARNVGKGDPKVLFPTGAQAKATMFASPAAREILRGAHPRTPVLVGEGLTDFLALATASPIPVVCGPGTPFLVDVVGAWVGGRCLYLAFDMDAAGSECVESFALRARECGASEVLIMNWPSGCGDACEALGDLGREGFQEFLERELGDRKCRKRNGRA